jgi:hypothetical protein
MPKGQYVSRFPRGGSRHTKPLEERFWEKVTIVGLDECWLWVGGVFRNGMHYGQFQYEGRPHNAHRIAWVLTNGEIPTGVRVLHSCDNPPCVNPRHLFLGSDADNMKDMATKGRGRLQRPFNRAVGDRHGMHLHPERVRRGEAHPRSILTDEVVLEVRRLHREGTKQSDLSRQFGIEKTVLSKVVNRRTWRHLP